MIIDKDKPWTWKKFREGACRTCRGTCCTMPVEIKLDDLIRMGLATEDEAQSPKKVFKRLKKEGVISSYREASQLFMLSQQANDDCYFLDSKTRLCTVYDRRPFVCREFPSVGPKPGFCPQIEKK